VADKALETVNRLSPRAPAAEDAAKQDDMSQQALKVKESIELKRCARVSSHVNLR
jgi:hypothetical protein